MNESDDRGPRRQRRAGDVPAAVSWYEGMLLAPQHFQLASQREEALVHYHASVVSPFHWGLVELERSRVSDGVLSISRLEAVLPDGLLVSHTGRDAGDDLFIDVKAHKDRLTPGKTATIFLAVAARQPGERFRKRYTASDERAFDENSGSDELSIAVLQPKLTLEIAEDDYLPESSVGFPIAKVAMRASTVEEIDYEPPWVRVGNGSAVYRICHQVAEELREKATALAATITQQSSSLHGPQLLETRMLVHSLVSGLPGLEGLLKSNVAHPFSLYLAMASIYGNIAPGTVPERIEPYDHNDLLRVFRRLRMDIETTIRTAIRAPYTLHPFTFDKETFRLRIDPSWLKRPMLLGVRAAAGVKARELDAWVGESAIGTASKIESLRVRRATGVKREAVRGDDLVPASGVTFYALNPPYDDLLVPSEELVIANNDSERRPDEVVLYVNTGV